MTYDRILHHRSDGLNRPQRAILCTACAQLYTHKNSQLQWVSSAFAGENLSVITAALDGGT